MNRWVILLFVFLLLGIVGLSSKAAPPSPPLGIVKTDCDSVNIIRNDGQTLTCRQGVVLFEGDHLVGVGAASVQVRWYNNNARTNLINPNEIQVAVYQPSKIEQLIDNFLDFLGIRNGRNKSVDIVTRSPNPANDPQLKLAEGAKTVLTYANGDRYEGEVVDGKRQGYGTLYAADGAMLKQGRWENDVFVVSK